MTAAEVRALVGLLNEYGFGKFGDEWWPGNAEPYIGAVRAVELRRLLELADAASDALRPRQGPAIAIVRRSDLERAGSWAVPDAIAAARQRQTVDTDDQEDQA